MGTLCRENYNCQAQNYPFHNILMLNNIYQFYNLLMSFSKNLNLVGFRYHSQDFLANGIKAEIILIGVHYQPQSSLVKRSKTINNIYIFKKYNTKNFTNMSQKPIKTIQLISLLLMVSFMMAESFRKRDSTVAFSKVTTISDYFDVVMFVCIIF